MVTSIPKESPKSVDADVVMITHFSLDWLQALGECDRNYPTKPISIRIRSRHGTVGAGVVATGRFLYYVRGDAVIVASRLSPLA